MRVSFPIRKMCRLVGDTASRNIERLSYASRLQARKLINTTSKIANLTGYIVASSEDLLNLFTADCGALSIHDETELLGKTEGHLQEILAMLEFLRLRKIGSVMTSTDLSTDFPDVRYAPGFLYIAGVLFVPLSSTGNDFIVFFRKSTLKEVKWAGNPYEKFVKEGTEGYLEPRKSFKTWSEIVVGKCRDWSEQNIETAAVLCLIYGKFTEVWRQKEAALQSSLLEKLLLSNSAHEVRTPLHAIINYLEISLEGNICQETRDNLSRSHSASKSLVYVINDLLDPTKTEEGLDLVKEEVFDFHVMLQEATEPFQGDARRKGIEYQVSRGDDIPKCLVGDPRQVRQVVSNIIANAIQNTSTSFVKVDVGKSPEQLSPDKIEIEFAVEDSGAGMPQEKVDALFRELEQV
jgi:light-regulated signal transduction histidine kinase (bacteriophytochrome)